MVWWEGRKNVSYKAAATLDTYQNDVYKFSFQACRYQKSSILPIKQIKWENYNFKITAV